MSLMNREESDSRDDDEEDEGLKETENKDSEPCYKSLRLLPFLSVCIVSFGSYIAGSTVVYPAVALPSLYSANQSDYHLSATESSYFVSIASLGMLGGCLLSGCLVTTIGRKKTLIFGMCGNLAVSYLLLGTAQGVWSLLFGRLLSGSGLGFSTSVSTLYIMEISGPRLRGSLATFPAIAGTLGVLSCQILGSYLNWHELALFFLSLTAPLLILLLIIPESPVYLVSSSRNTEARKILVSLRTCKQQDIDDELQCIETSLLLSSSSFSEKTSLKSINKLFSVFSFSSHQAKAFALSLILLFFFQCSAINIILMYTVEIFQKSASSVNEFEATVFVGLALLASNLLSLLLVNIAPRRLMLCISSFGISVSLSCLSLVFHVYDSQRSSSSSFSSASSSTFSSLFPLFSLLSYVIFFSLGYGTLIWIIIAEILPLSIRSRTQSLSVSLSCLLSFATSVSYETLKELLSLKGVFALYALLSAFGTLFIICYVPETKGKTEKEIEEHFISSVSSPSLRV